MCALSTLLTLLGPQFFSMPVTPSCRQAVPSVPLFFFLIPVYFNCLTFLPQATVEVGDSAHLLCPTLRIFK